MSRSNIVLATTAGLSLLLLLVWIFYDPTGSFVPFVPGMDKTADTLRSAGAAQVRIGSDFKKSGELNSTLTGRWPGFRGSNRDNILKVDYPILQNWTAKAPKIVWSIPTGEGYAAPAIYDGRVYFIDYDESLKADVLKCLALETGAELWRRWYAVRVKRNHGMSRTIPAVNEQVVVTMGPRCHVMATDRLTGDLKWGIDLEKTYQTETPLWYTGQCPLIEDNVAVLAVGGSKLMIGVDCGTGKTLWETPNEKGWKMSHSSVVPMTIAHKKMYVYAAIGGIFAVSAEPADAGTLLWSLAEWAPSVIAPSPVYLGNDRIFLTAGYGAGGAVIKISAVGGKFKASLETKFGPNEGLASEQQTPIVDNGYIYGILPKDAAANRNQFVCYRTTDLKHPVWQSGKTNRYGLGPYMKLNDRFLILNDEGQLTLIEASRTGFSQVAQKQVFEGSDAWGPFAFADGYLLLRDSKNLYCLNLKP